MMTKDELTARIAAGSAFLQRTDITAEQESLAKAKLERYREQLREMDKDLSSREKAQVHIDTIRSILKRGKGSERPQA